MKFFCISFFVIIYCILLPAQNTDSLFNVFINRYQTTNIQNMEPYRIENAPVKCGFPLMMQVYANFNNYNETQKSLIKRMADRPVMHKSIVSPSGFFRIHYDTSGINSPDFDNDGLIDKDISWIGLSADSVYDYQINFLGFLPPPSDENLGGDEKYDIYVIPVGYGETMIDCMDCSTSSSYIKIDNTFSRTFTRGINGGRVTIAHEFQHSIQLGSYIIRWEDLFYYEISATAMEEFIYDKINDYYQYLPNYFNSPHNKSFLRMSSLSDGYDLAIWNIFLVERFGSDILKRVWEIMRTERAMDAVALAIQEKGSSLKEELSEFGIWTYFTNKRALENKYFKEAKNYPLIKPSEVIDRIEGRQLNTYCVSNTYLEYRFEKNGFSDTLAVIISNSYIESGLSNPQALTQVDLQLSENYFSNSYRISEYVDIYAKLSNSMVFSDVYIYNNVPVQFFSRNIISSPYPQPFKNSQKIINFPAEPGGTNEAELHIYDVNMMQVYSGNESIKNTGQTVISWFARDNSGHKLSSGIYFYVVKSGDKISKGKFAVIND
ncbi:MAG: T9SS type A sorting domain-containing protein [Ignavibacteria bacterium]|nr:T9SS type A sorting domain-containing protein [Ignavibacteria bacterium]